jgi:hypothetical protein
MNEDRRWHEQSVPWAIFIWVIGIFTLATTTMFVQHDQLKIQMQKEIDSRIQGDVSNNATAAEIKTALAGIQSDLKNLDARLVELKADIKALK